MDYNVGIVGVHGGDDEFSISGLSRINVIE